MKINEKVQSSGMEVKKTAVDALNMLCMLSQVLALAVESNEGEKRLDEENCITLELTIGKNVTAFDYIVTENTEENVNKIISIIKEHGY